MAGGRWKGREDGLVEKSRDMGVSWLCVATAIWMWTFHEGAVVGFGSRKEDYVDKLGDPKKPVLEGPAVRFPAAAGVPAGRGTARRFTRRTCGS